jgi:hypothetical protein
MHCFLRAHPSSVTVVSIMSTWGAVYIICSYYYYSPADCWGQACEFHLSCLRIIPTPYPPARPIAKKNKETPPNVLKSTSFPSLIHFVLSLLYAWSRVLHTHTRTVFLLSQASMCVCLCVDGVRCSLPDGRWPPHKTTYQMFPSFLYSLHYLHIYHTFYLIEECTTTTPPCYVNAASTAVPHKLL